ncbi:hypothetical protein ACH50O_11755 [Methylomonas sp. 2BW1-5-20]|uniref:hypothetical protein n=1 Tax=Methylomonas sp. 2BW1-5-20 TaxID=3376686 RepID=UPI00404D9D20
MNLSKHAIAELRHIKEFPVPTCSINPGVASKLIREGLAISVMLKSPFKSHKGGDCPHLQITDAGRGMV